MAAPVWNTPASGSQVAASGNVINHVTYAGGYWFSVTRPTGSTSNVVLRYASDPSGAWGTATLPAVPTGYDRLQIPGDSGVITDGTTYALHLRYTDISSNVKCRVVYCTDPSGTWSAHEYDATDLYRGSSLSYGNGTWAISGQYRSGSPFPGFIATASSASGTYSFVTAGTATGYDNSVATNIAGIAYGGSTWVSFATRSGSANEVRYSTSPTSSWGTATIATVSGAGLERLKVEPGGYFTVSQYANADDTNNGFFYSSDAATWSLVDGFGEGFDSTRTTYIGEANGTWVLGGIDEAPGVYEYPRLSYADGVAPTGAFSPTSTTFGTATGGAVLAVAGGGRYIVAGSNRYGELRYSLAPLIATRPTLRQRQSPRRSPSRVDYPDLRQRQTPYIR